MPSNTLNRKKSPEIRQVTDITLPEHQLHRLENQIPVYEVRLGTQEVLKLEIVFAAGRPEEHKQLVSRAATRLLRDGTLQHTSAEIAHILEFHAGTLQTPINMDTCNMVLYCMTKHFSKLMPLVAEMLLQPAYPQKELDTFIANNAQRLQVELTKNDTLAYREITEKIFGTTHPYGYNSFPETYKALTVKDLQQFHQDFLTADNCTIFISGFVTDDTLAVLNNCFGKHQSQKKAKIVEYKPKTEQPRPIFIENKGTVQTAIRIGRRLFDRQHPDFAGMFVLNTILGGYFGSRLMANIREEKGYTYNIYSTLDTMHLDGCLYIGTEVGNEYAKATLEEIYKELEILRTELIPQAELEMVRAYLMGNMLNMIDGAFAVADVLKTLISENTPLTAFPELVNTVKEISSEELLRLAQLYFQPADLWEVVVGEKI